MKTKKIRLGNGKIVDLLRLTGNGIVVRYSEADIPNSTAREREQWLPHGTSYSKIEQV